MEAEETYSPVTLRECIRIFPANAISKGHKLKQMDVSSAYLHSTLDEPVYIRPPLNMEGIESSKIWKCTKALYGLRNAGKAWYHTKRNVMQQGGSPIFDAHKIIRLSSPTKLADQTTFTFGFK